MVKFVDSREREKEILDLVVESYIEESKPISSSYLCERYNLSYSSATVRNVMKDLEERGFLSHIHTSSGRVPTQGAYKHYVEEVVEKEFMNCPVNVEAYYSSLNDTQEIINYTLDLLAQISGYTSLLALSGRDARFSFRGARFMFNQPEFEDINRLRDLFYILEVKMAQLQNLLFSCLGENIKILIGDEIGFKEISECSLLVSGAREKDLSFALAILGPMRMDYVRAASCLSTIAQHLKKSIDDIL